VGCGEGVSPSALGKGSDSAPSPENCSYFFAENTIFWRILTRLFLKSYGSGRGSNPPPPNPLLGTPLF